MLRASYPVTAGSIGRGTPAMRVQGVSRTVAAFEAVAMPRLQRRPLMVRSTRTLRGRRCGA